MTSTAPCPPAPTLLTSWPWTGPAGGEGGLGWGSLVPPGRCHSPVLSVPCRSQGDGAGDGGFPGKESLAEFLGWLDFLDELVMGAHPVRITGLINLGIDFCSVIPSSSPAQSSEWHIATPVVTPPPPWAAPFQQPIAFSGKKFFLIPPKPPWMQFKTVSSSLGGSHSQPLPQLVADAITEAVEEKFFQGILQPQLLQM